MSAVFALMDGLIDYAGLFPPAALDMETAVMRYAGHRRTPEARMLNRFVVPAEALGAFGEAADRHLGADERWGLSVLVGARDDAEVALARTAAQGLAVAGLAAHGSGRLRVEALETPVPAAAVPSVEEFLPRLLEGLAAAGLDGRELWIETPAGGDDTAVAAAVARLAAAADGSFPRLGLKLRCGGLVAAAFPAPQRIATVIEAARERGLALKFTAGLHHPVRFQAEDPRVMMHGFLNVYGAGLLAWSTDLRGDDLVACLAETDPAAFVFDDDRFSWRGHAVAAADVRRIRRDHLGGFGSCSFREPREDLVTLGLL